MHNVKRFVVLCFADVRTER